MAKWSQGTITLDGMKLHYYRTGGDKPQVVLNHGAGDDGLCWTHLARELEKDYDLVLPDARGHGKSGSGKGCYSAELRAADLAGLIRALGLDRPVVGGHSMGADTCLHFAAAYPDLTRGVILEDPPVVLPGEKLGQGEQAVELENVGKMMAKFMRLFKRLPKFIGVRLARKSSPTYPQDEILPWVDSKKRLSRDFLRVLAGPGMEMTGPFEVFQKIAVPVLLIIGDKEKMSIMSPQAAQKAVETNSRVKVVRLEGASHDIRRTRFEGYLSALRDFLDGIYHSSTPAD